MVAEFDEIEIAHRREQLLEIRRWVGSSRRQRRRQAALAAATAGALGLPSAEADALVSLARLDGLAGRNDDVETQLASAVERAREAGHVPTELRATYNLASDVYGRGDVRRGSRAVRQGARPLRRAGRDLEPVRPRDPRTAGHGAVRCRGLGRQRPGRADRRPSATGRDGGPFE